MKHEIIECKGISPIFIGYSKDKIIEILGNDFRDKQSIFYKNCYRTQWNNKFMVDFDSNNIAIGIEVPNVFDVYYKGMCLSNKKLKDIQNILMDKNIDFKSEKDSLIIQQEKIVFWFNNIKKIVTTILVYEENYNKREKIHICEKVDSTTTIDDLYKLLK